MTIGIHNGHSFLITNINKVTNNYTCIECDARFTQACHLTRHAQRCTRGQTKTVCLGKRIIAPESAFEKAFYPEGTFGKKATCWLEWEAKQRGIHIHHHRCGHGGERYLCGYSVDGYHPESKTVFEFQGCHLHGCVECFPEFDQRYELIYIDREGNPVTRNMAYQNPVQKLQSLREAGYNVVERWEHEEPRPWCKDRCLGKRNKTYPHAIVYDLEAYQDKTKAALPTRHLSYESENVRISVSIADTLNPHPEYICSKDFDELIQLFYRSLEQRSAAIREDVAAKYMPPEGEGLPEKQCKLIEQWCNQVPVVGFNSGQYDLKIIRHYFVSQLAQEN